MHPTYSRAENSHSYNNDFALVQLGHPIDFDVLTHVRPVCLPPFMRSPPEGTKAIVTGWGHTSEGGRGSNALMEAELSVVDCNKFYGESDYNITDSILCAGVGDGRIGGRDACQV